MENFGTFPDGEWECCRRMFAIEDHDDSSLLLGEDDGNFGVQSMFYSSNSHNNNNLKYMSQENNHSLADTNYFFNCFDHVVANNSDISENFDHGDQVQPIVFPTKQLKLKRLLGVSELEDKIHSCVNPKKKPRTSKDVSFVYVFQV